MAMPTQTSITGARRKRVTRGTTGTVIKILGYLPDRAFMWNVKGKRQVRYKDNKVRTSYTCRGNGSYRIGALLVSGSYCQYSFFKGMGD